MGAVTRLIGALINHLSRFVLASGVLVTFVSWFRFIGNKDDKQK